MKYFLLVKSCLDTWFSQFYPTLRYNIEVHCTLFIAYSSRNGVIVDSKRWQAALWHNVTVGMVSAFLFLSMLCDCIYYVFKWYFRLDIHPKWCSMCRRWFVNNKSVMAVGFDVYDEWKWRLWDRWMICGKWISLIGPASIIASVQYHECQSAYHVLFLRLTYIKILLNTTTDLI